MHLLASIVGVTLFINGCATILEHFRVSYRALLPRQVLDERADVICLDEILALLESKA